MKNWTEAELKEAQARIAAAGDVTEHKMDAPKVKKTPSARKARWYTPETDLAQQIRLSMLPMPTPQYRFDPMRKWRVDFAWPVRKLALEVEGGVHRIEEKFKRDIFKYNELALRGWVLVRVTNRMVRSGEALAVVERLLGAKKSPESPKTPEA